jgi:hypothetical protein
MKTANRSEKRRKVTDMKEQQGSDGSEPAREPYWYHPDKDSGDLDDLIFEGEYIKPISEK